MLIEDGMLSETSILQEIAFIGGRLRIQSTAVEWGLILQTQVMIDHD